MNFSLRNWCLVMVATSALGALPATAQIWKIPSRSGPIPLTSDGVPHFQLGAEAIPAITAQLMHRVSKIPGVEFSASFVTGATGFSLNERVKLARPDVIVHGREFAHKHADGSLHASLPPKVAVMAVQAGWAAHHPWATERPGWEGFVLLFAPKTMDELDVVFRLIMQAYRFVTEKKTNTVTEN